MTENNRPPTQVECAQIVDDYIAKHATTLIAGLNTILCKYVDNNATAIFKIPLENGDPSTHVIDVMFNHEVIYSKSIEGKPKCVTKPIFISEMTTEEIFRLKGELLPPEFIGGVNRIYGLNDVMICSAVCFGEAIIFTNHVTQECTVHKRNHLLTVSADCDQVVANQF